MPLTAGTRLGDCEILGPLGAGGMGEVYRARDLNLGREVAIKVLPAELALDPGRLRRFEQEARASAALNHPNILAVYRFGAGDDGAPYEVTELLQGQTVREKLQQGPLPVRKTIDYALQITRGLAAAHDRGIVHRDLKPENLFITRDGVVKILDFGLAKFVDPDPSGVHSTIAAPTSAGVVLGTAGYMSPEQVRGQTVDQRSDLFSLGAVIYEMLSGNRAFPGTISADAISAILKDEPAELSGIVAALPPALGHIVHRCLEKNSDDRFQSARDLAFNLELLTRDSSSSSSRSAVVPKPSRRIPASALLALTATVAVAAGITAAKFLAKPPERNPVVLKRLTDFVGMEEFPALSPDGKSVAFTADAAGRRQVWVRLLSGGAPLQVTHDDADHQTPRWSPDSASLIYFSPSEEPDGEGRIWEIPALGGAAHPIVASMGSGDISHDGKRIAYFHSEQGQIQLTVADRDGANARKISALPPEFSYSDLRWSPDDSKLGYLAGRTFDYDVFYVPASGGKPQNLTLEGNPMEGFAWLPDNSGVVYSTSRGGTVLYLQTVNLWSVHIGGKDRRQLTFGETSYTSPDLAANGDLVASRLRIQFDLWRFPVDGAAEENVRRGEQLTHQTGAVQTPSVGPGDREIVYLSDSGGHGNLWVLDMATRQSRQLTFEQDPAVTLGVPVWSPDGKYISYVKRSSTGWNVDAWLMNADGTNSHKVTEGGGWACWSPDSRWLYVSPPTATGFCIRKMAAEGGPLLQVREEGQKPAIAADGKLYFTTILPASNGMSDMQIMVADQESGPARILARIAGSRLSPYILTQPVLSPDGKWLALLLNDSSTTNIWAQPAAGGQMRRITDFGRQAVFITRRVSWSGDGKSIYAAVGKGEADIVLLSNLRP